MGVPLRVGIIGVVKISEQYLANLPTFPGLRLVAVADLNQERAQQVADEQGVRALTVDALIDDPEIDAVLNLTIPAAHVEIGTRALKAGKHVFAEKPLGLNPAEAAPMLDRIPLGRFVYPAEVSEVAVWLASDAAAVINGVELPVDGGLLVT